MLHRALDDLLGLLLGQRTEVNRMNISTWAVVCKDALERRDTKADSRLLRKWLATWNEDNKTHLKGFKTPTLCIYVEYELNIL